MDTMHPIDWQITKSLHDMQRGMAVLTSTRNSVHDRLAVNKAQLDEEWQREMEPVIRDLYWYPLRNGIDALPQAEEDLRPWLEEQYDDAAIVAILLLLLQRYSYRAYNLGGQTGLEFLDIDELFRLQNDEIVAQIEQFNTDLVAQGTEFSLIDTTIDDLETQIKESRRSESNVLLALAAFIATRSLQRTETIERSERPRWVGRALSDTYQRNGVQYEMYDINGIGCPERCEPLHGHIWRIGYMPAGHRIPQHPRCDCIYTPVLHDGQVVGYPPIVANVANLTEWSEPEDTWTGQ